MWTVKSTYWAFISSKSKRILVPTEVQSLLLIRFSFWINFNMGLFIIVRRLTLAMVFIVITSRRIKLDCVVMFLARGKIVTVLWCQWRVRKCCAWEGLKELWLMVPTLEVESWNYVLRNKKSTTTNSLHKPIHTYSHLFVGVTHTLAMQCVWGPISYEYEYTCASICGCRRIDQEGCNMRLNKE